MLPAVAVTFKAVGCVMVIVALPVFATASVTVNVWLPAVRVKVPVPVYGAVPPDAATVTVLLPPLQAMAVGVAVTVSVTGVVAGPLSKKMLP